jgi:hypothetical protein
MDKNAWISKKREILSKIFNSKTADKTLDWGFLTQETPNKKQNNYSVRIDSWTDLLYASSDINPSVEPTSYNIHPCGFIVGDELGQAVLNKAFGQALFYLNQQTDTDEDIIKDAIHDYISNNKLSAKGFYYLIKKLKNLQLEDLPDLQA